MKIKWTNRVNFAEKSDFPFSKDSIQKLCDSKTATDDDRDRPKVTRGKPNKEKRKKKNPQPTTE